MRDDIPAAAFRLMNALPVRTHERKVIERAPNLGNRSVHQGRGITVIFGKGGKARRVLIDGVNYESVTDAARTMHKSPKTIYGWLRVGQAVYV